MAEKPPVYATDEQTRFSALFARASELYQAKHGKKVPQALIAERLGVTPASISQYLAFKQTPQESKIKLLQLFVDELEGKVHYPQATQRVAGMRSEAVEQAADELNEIHDAHPETFRVLKEMIEVTRQNVKPKGKPNSKVTDRARSLVKKGIEGHQGNKA